MFQFPKHYLLSKKEKDFETADAIRQELLDKGIEIKDTREGTVWNVISAE